jgi:hypothetical protein
VGEEPLHQRIEPRPREAAEDELVEVRAHAEAGGEVEAPRVADGEHGQGIAHAPPGRVLLDQRAVADHCSGREHAEDGLAPLRGVDSRPHRQPVETSRDLRVHVPLTR